MTETEPETAALAQRIPLLGRTAEQMRESGPLRDLPSYRARQIAHWLYARGEHDPENMTDLPRWLRTALAAAYELGPDPVDSVQCSAEDGTAKYLFRLADGKRVEAVLIRAPERITLCVSSQAGCAYGCDFCATARMGPGRNLTAREILSQIVTLRREVRAEGGPLIHNLVFMGMGEPLQNLDHLLTALRLLQDPEGIALGWRRITVSTVGLIPQIHRLADSEVPVRLAYSLSATTNATRDALMPINRKYPFRDVFRALEYYQQKTGTRITLEYVLLDGVNDTLEDAHRLAGFGRRLGAKINLIVYNVHAAAPYRPSSVEKTQRFLESLEGVAPAVTLRQSRGRDILAACGQLSTRWMQSSQPATP